MDGIADQQVSFAMLFSLTSDMPMENDTNNNESKETLETRDMPMENDTLYFVQIITKARKAGKKKARFFMQPTQTGNLIKVGQHSQTSDAFSHE